MKCPLRATNYFPQIEYKLLSLDVYIYMYNFDACKLVIMAETEIDPAILSEIMDNIFDQEPDGDFDLVSQSERLFREVDPDMFLQSNENNNTRKKDYV